MDKLLSIIIADDDTVFPYGLKIILSNINKQFNIRMAKNGTDLIDRLHEEKADLIFLDYNMPEMDGAEAARIINTSFPKTKIIVCTYFKERETIQKMMGASIQGYLLKETKKENIYAALSIVMQGGEFYSDEIKETIKKIMADSLHHEKTGVEKNKFTERELEIIDLVCRKFSNGEIAVKLFISKRTVETHLHHIYVTSGANSHETLCRYAEAHRLFKNV